MTERFSGLRATVMGLGTRAGGAGVARYLAEAGAIVTVTDTKPATALHDSIAAMAGLPIRFVIGGHDERDFTPAGADLIVRNPGVRRGAPLLQLARQHGLPVEMEMTLFFRACPAPIVGITGTKGKTSTATICAAMLRAWDPRTVLAGNMGVSALARLPEIVPETPVVLELSSWQLEGLAEHRLAPRIAVLTMIAEDHLDAYDDFDDYAETKRSIARSQSAGDDLVLNRDDDEAWRAGDDTAARVVPFGHTDRGDDGAWFADRSLLWRWRGENARVVLADIPALAGPHNAANTAAAMAAARLRGAPHDAIVSALATYHGVKDRMEPVAEIAGVRYINDTSATAPVAAAAALRSFAGHPVHLLAGGADKRLDPSPLIEAAVTNAAAIYLLDGTATPAIERGLRRAGCPPVGTFTGMREAVHAAAAAATAGDVVLLSPGCASFGLFRDEFDRGEQFRRRVREMTSLAATLPAVATSSTDTGGDR